MSCRGERNFAIDAEEKKQWVIQGAKVKNFLSTVPFLLFLPNGIREKRVTLNKLSLRAGKNHTYESQQLHKQALPLQLVLQKERDNWGRKENYKIK